MTKQSTVGRPLSGFRPVAPRRPRLASNARAFSLVELVIVIVIIGIIAAIAVPRFSAATEGADKKATKSSIVVLQNAIELFKAETGNLPATLGALESTADCIGDPAGSGNCGPYIRKIPTNQLNGSSAVDNYDSGAAETQGCLANNTIGWAYDLGTGKIEACSDGAATTWDEQL